MNYIVKNYVIFNIFIIVLEKMNVYYVYMMYMKIFLKL